jgi:hypothetical protein
MTQNLRLLTLKFHWQQETRMKIQLLPHRKHRACLIKDQTFNFIAGNNLNLLLKKSPDTQIP